ncbi:MAG: metallophosphoesterase [Longimicrobiales bacterium]
MNHTIRRLAIAAAGAAAATAAYALFIEPRWLQCTRTHLHFAELPGPLEGLRIAILTDLHARRSSPARLVERAVRMAQQERPDIVAITGDIAETEEVLEQTLDVLATLSARLGVYIVPGNHDYRDVGIERWHDAVSRRRTLTDLTNRARFIDVPRADQDDFVRLCVAGVDDLAEGTPHLDALHDRRQRDFTILLAHNPDQAERARRGVDRVDLILSGHTHGGQVRLPGFGAIVSSAERPDLYEAGVRRRPWTQVYTSRGIGTVHLPIRFLTRPEVSVLTLTSEPRRQSARQRRRWARREHRHRPGSRTARNSAAENQRPVS